jgi:two-component system phosphate regulon sensor histidine kinase PhoR
MQRLVQDLLLLAQADAKRSIELAEVQLDTVVLEVFMQAQVLASARQQTFKMEHFEAAQVEGDAEQLKRAILNLVENAIKYTQEGGAVSVALYGGKRWTRVVIKDNGVGIAPQDQPHIFDRFYRVDKARSRGSGGTGLGLAIVKHIVEAHGGRISLESELGQGATFTVWLPLLSESTPTPDEDSELEPEKIEGPGIGVQVNS